MTKIVEIDHVMNELTIWQISCGDLHQYFFDSKIHISTKIVRKLMTTIHHVIKRCNGMESMST